MKTRLRPKFGYKPKAPLVDAVFNRSLALALILITLPLLLAISGMLLVTQGREILYRGPRLGRNRQTFWIYKFRTLDTARAQTMTRDRVLPKNSGLETPLGGFLRATRLDELPQLLNVLNGTMVFFGPRPVRAEIAEIESRFIPNYNARFEVTPGFVGFSQALMSHGTAKRYRGMFNTRLCRQEAQYFWTFMFLFIVGTNVLYRTVFEFLPWSKGRFGLGSGVAMRLETPTGRRYRMKVTRDGNIAIRGELNLLPGSECVLIRALGSRLRTSRVMVTGACEEDGESVFEVKPMTPQSRHFFDRYFLHDVVVPPIGGLFNIGRPVRRAVKTVRRRLKQVLGPLSPSQVAGNGR